MEVDLSSAHHDVSPALLPSLLLNSHSQRSNESASPLRGDSPTASAAAAAAAAAGELSPQQLEAVYSFLNTPFKMDPQGPVDGEGASPGSATNKRSYLSFLLNSGDEGQMPQDPAAFPASCDLPAWESDQNTPSPVGAPKEAEAFTFQGQDPKLDFFDLERPMQHPLALAHSNQEPAAPPREGANWQPGASSSPKEPRLTLKRLAEQEDFLDFFKVPEGQSGEAQLLARIVSPERTAPAAAEPAAKEKPLSPPRDLGRQNPSVEASPALAISLLSSAALSLGIEPLCPSKPTHPRAHAEPQRSQTESRKRSRDSKRPPSGAPASGSGKGSAASSVNPELNPKKKPKIQDLVLFWLKGQKFFQDLQVAVNKETTAEGTASPESVGSESKGTAGGQPLTSPGTVRSERRSGAGESQEHCGESVGGCDTLEKRGSGVSDAAPGKWVHPVEGQGPVCAGPRSSLLRPVLAREHSRVESFVRSVGEEKASLERSLEDPSKDDGRRAPCSSGNPRSQAADELWGDEDWDNPRPRRSPLSGKASAEAPSDRMDMSDFDKATGRINPRSLVEKKRRERISLAFSGLKDVVNVQGDMAQVLREATRLIKQQQMRLHEYHEKELMHKLRKDIFNERRSSH